MNESPRSLFTGVVTVVSPRLRSIAGMCAKSAKSICASVRATVLAARAVWRANDLAKRLFRDLCSALPVCW